ncbi:hypothetical protein H0H87_010033 [Tephrocybe sp. NHM501043]|nr:hypothetical protein H0H87_010033 [Tephrocybe sp. NHM501043]
MSIPLPSRCAVRGSIIRNIVRPGETLSSYRYERRVGGKGANQAISILKAGGLVDFYGAIGDDGLWVRETVARLGLDPNSIEISGAPTGRALIQIADSGENSIILFPGANHSQLIEEKWITSGTTLPKCTHLLLQNEIHMESTLYALNNANDTTTIFNPSPMLSAQQIKDFPWGKVDWLIVNEGEAEDLFTALYGQAPTLGSSRVSPEEIMKSLWGHSSFQTTNIVCTLGADGVSAFLPAFHRRKKALYIPAATLQGTVRDTTGAGRLLHWAAGMCVEKPGTIDSLPTMDEVLARMSEQ